MGGLSRQELVEEISKETLIRPEVVSEVLNSLTDIAIETILKDGEFNLMNLFKVKSYEVKKVYIPSNPKHPNPSQDIGKAQKRLKSSLSENIRRLFRIQNKHFPDQPGLINRDTWKGALKWEKEIGKNKIILNSCSNSFLNTGIF